MCVVRERERQKERKRERDRETQREREREKERDWRLMSRSLFITNGESESYMQNL